MFEGLDRPGDAVKSTIACGRARGTYYPRQELALTDQEEEHMTTLQDVKRWRGMKMADAGGDKVAMIEEILLDRQTGERAWAAVETRLRSRPSCRVRCRSAEQLDESDVRSRAC